MGIECMIELNKGQAGELSEISLISEIFVSSSEKISQVFLPNAYAFREFLIFRLNFQRFFLHCGLHSDKRYQLTTCHLYLRVMVNDSFVFNSKSSFLAGH
jgi:hypothetical protein